MLNKFKLSTRILLMGLVIVIAFSLVFAWAIPRIRRNMYDAKKEEIKKVVEAAWSITDFYAKKSSLPPDEAKKMVMAAIKNMRYGGDEYFWINDKTPRMVMHPIKPELDGQDLSDYKDPNGKKIFVAMADVCQKTGEGLVDYQWPKVGSSKPSPKISYVKLVSDWGWIIGSGVYIDDVEKEVATFLYVLIGVGVVVAVGGLALAFFMARSISGPITRVIEGLTAGAEQVASGSSQVSSASQSLAEGASEQAAGIEETSSSIEEMSSMTKQNADNASQANSLMTETSLVVEKANEAMKELTRSMSEISTASEETGKIIKTIDEIAFQTNLLALNAAVEAARAGEAGAGFAVVADEVRNLAMRAAEAAKNTSNLIEGTVKKVKGGSEIVGRTNEAFAKVAQGAKKVSELVGEIAAASQEQSQGIEQINKAVSEMDKVVQGNAASAEESASASEEMNAQAEQMSEYVNELAALVGGRREHGAQHIRALQTNRDSNENTNYNLPAAGQLKAEPKRSITTPGQNHKQKNIAVWKAVKVHPEQVTPMEDQTFGEF
jgi:methyl-accepting chemotaxis protein